MKKLENIFTWPLVLVACATLGLAPFTPEPHIWANLKWVWGGAVGMQMMNWLDLAFHGLPWAILLIKLLGLLKPKVS